MAQRGDPTRPTRFKGPTVITLRGAGSSGNDPLKVGDGTDVGLTIQVPFPTVVNASGEVWGQTANIMQFESPAGTIIKAWGPFGQIAVNAIAASGAVPVANADYVITDPGVAVLTLAAPIAGTQDGVSITITSATAFAHTLTATGLLQTATAAVNEATFAAYAGASLSLKAYQGKWLVTSSVGIVFS